jgi:hypothetical protein
MNAIMGKNAMIEVASVLRFSFLNDFAAGAVVAIKLQNCATPVLSNEKIEIRHYGSGQASAVKYKHS